MSDDLFFETTTVAELTARGIAATAEETKSAPTVIVQTRATAQVRRTVLVVDDEQIIADTLVAILNHNGFHASAAYSGESAMDFMRTGRPDLLISDVNMPGVSGVELAIATRDLWPDCKVLLFSGHAATLDILHEAHGRGYDFELLNKPVHPRDLLERIAG